jgi:hemolysin activation/secretion protein
LPPPEQLLPPPQTPQPPAESPEVPATIFVERFNVLGSTVFSPEELAEATQEFAGRNLSFAELLQARSAITQLYVDNGYVTSGAFIPPQTLEGNVVTIQVVEGSLEAINITGNRRLNASYIRSRLELAGSTPVNVPRLLEGLQLLQLDPLIENISADLQAGVRPGTSVLQVEVAEADTFDATLTLNNTRSPSVGSFRRQLQVSEANLLGLGDGLSIGYTNTDGSNGIDASYTVPLNPRNGTLRLAYGTTGSSVIEEPFDQVDIDADSRYYELTFRQPIAQSPNEEFVLGITASRQETQTEVEDRPFALSAGSDAEGRTRVTAVRFFQEWTQRSSQHVLAARSQFNLGLDLLDPTINENAPDSRFLAWRGQGQWVRLLAPDTLLLVRGDLQLADGPLLSLEQFGLGGQETVRGYRQDALLTDNGALLSAELRFPILRTRRTNGVLQIVPFIDIGTAWNNEGEDPDPSTLVGTGLGLLWRQGEDLSVRIDWGIPLVSIDSRNESLQENGIYFSVIYTPS